MIRLLSEEQVGGRKLFPSNFTTSRLRLRFWNHISSGWPKLIKTKFVTWIYSGGIMRRTEVLTMLLVSYPNWLTCIGMA